MADTLSTYFAVFKADLDGFLSPIKEARKQSDELNKSFAPLTKTLKDIGAAATVVGTALTVSLTAPIVAFGIAAVKNFDESAKAMASMEAALVSTGGAAGKTAEQLVALSKSLESQSIHDDDEILRGIIDTLLVFGNVSGDTFDRAADAALNLSDKFNKDLQASAIAVGKALEDPINGLGGLVKAGVKFGEDQKAVIKALVDTGDIAGAQKIILDELAVAVGGTSKAMSEAGTGPMKQLQIQIGNMSESWGKLITEAMNPFITKATELVKWIDSWSESTKIVVGIAAGLAATLGPVILAFGLIVTSVAAAIPGLVLVGTAIAGIGAPVIAAVAAIAALVAAVVGIGVAIVAFIASNDELSAKVVAAWEQIKSKAVELWDTMVPIFEEIATSISELWDAVGPSMETVVSTVSAMIDNLATAISGGLEIISGTIKVFHGLVTLDWEKFSAGIQQIWKVLWDAVKEVMQDALNIIADPLTKITGYLVSWGLATDDQLTAIKGLKKETVDFSGVLDGHAERLKEQQVAQAAAAKAVGDAAKAHEEAEKQFKKFREEVDKIKDSVTGSTQKHEALTAAINEMEKAGVPLEAIVAKLGSAIKSEYDQTKLLKEEMDPTIKRINDFADAQKTAKDKVEATVTQMKFLEGVMISAQPATQAMKDKLESIQELTGPKKYVEGMQELLDITAEVSEKVPEVFRMQEADAKAFLESFKDYGVAHREEVAKAEQAHADSIQRIWETAAGNITSGLAKAFTDILFEGGSFLSKMVDLAKSVAEQMLQALLVGLFAPLTAKLAGLGAQLGGLGGGSSAVGAAAGAAGGVGGGGGGGAAGVLGGLAPWGIGIGAGLVAGIGAWISSQAHHDANQVVQNIENPFWAAWGKILPSDRYSDLMMLPSDEARIISMQLMDLNKNYLALGNQFALGGSDQAKVWAQSMANTQPPLKGVLEALAKAEAYNPSKAGSTTMPDLGQTGTPISLEKLYPGLKQLATGTDYVPRTGAYMLHQGEAVIPASKNSGGGDINFNGNIIVNGQSGRELVQDFMKQLRINGEFKTRLRQELTPGY